MSVAVAGKAAPMIGVAHSTTASATRAPTRRGRNPHFDLATEISLPDCYLGTLWLVIWLWMAWMMGSLQTSAGLLSVVAQIVAVITFAEPSAPLLMSLVPSVIAFAIWSWVLSVSTFASYDAP